MSNPLRVALTGGIGSGKSAVANLFSELGAPIIDSDAISHEIVKPGQRALEMIVKEFGSSIKNKYEELDRKKLREMVFSDDEAKSRLENILHPLIYQEIEKQINLVNYPYCLVVIPLLIETQATERFDRVLIIDVSEKIQIARTIERDNITTALAKKIIDAQVKREERLKYADDIIENNADIKILKAQVEKLHLYYLNYKDK